MKKVFNIIIILAVLAGLGIGGKFAWDHFYGNKSDAIIFQTEEIKRADLMSVINASGTVEPEELVNVGAQVSGKIMSFGVDANGKQVDYGSKVTKGMVLARIDEVLYEAALKESNGYLFNDTPADKGGNPNPGPAGGNIDMNAFLRG